MSNTQITIKAHKPLVGEWNERFCELFWVPVVCFSVCQYVNFLYFHLFKNHWANFNLTQWWWHKSKYPTVKRIRVCSNEGLHRFWRGDSNEVANNINEIKNSVFRTTRSLSIKFDTKDSWIKRDSSLFKWGATPFSKGR